ncbi:MAG: extracellular solute-binding protein [Oscillospiraceae bacterium]
MKKRLLSLLVSAGLLCSLASCAASSAAPTDILTQKEIPAGKTPLTILVKNAFSINTFEKAVEEKFPEIEIVQVGNFSSDMGIAEYEARLKNNDLTDIVMTWPLDVGEQYWDDNLIDLSSLPLTGKYVTSMLDGISKDGKLYYLPGPSQVRGIVYNKTLFKENGWELPTDFNSFVKLCKTIENSGIRSLQLGFGNSEVLDTAFVGYGFESCFSKPENMKFLSDYNNGIGSFADNFAPALNTFQTLIDEGVFQKDDLNITYADRERMLFTRKCAMVEDSVILTHMGFDYTGCTDEFALMPFFNPGAKNDWVRLYPVCYIGINKRLALPANEEKYALVMQLLEYISTPEGQSALSGDTGGMFSSLKSAAPPDAPEIEALIPALTHGRYAIFPTPKNAQHALRKGLTGMLNGNMTAADVVKIADAENASPPIPATGLPLGDASENFSLIETGNFITDTMRAESGCEIALFLDNGKDGKYNGKGLNGKLYKGTLTPIDIKRILPDLRYGEKGELWEITMTGADLVKTLEYAIPVDNNRSGWFYYFSGLKMKFAPAAEPGSRICSITTETGRDIEPERLYSIAVADDSVPEEFIKSCNKTGVSISNMLIGAIQDATTIVPSKDGRFIICNP